MFLESNVCVCETISSLIIGRASHVICHMTCHIEECTGVRLSLKFIVKHIEEGHCGSKVFVNQLVRAKCVRCPCGVVDGLRGKRSARRGCPRNFSIKVLAISNNSKILIFFFFDPPFFCDPLYF